ncbi:hypothetical protein ACFQVA_16170 [Actinomadura keratinilytica]
MWFLAFTVLFFSEASLPRLMLLAAGIAFLAPVARLTVRRVTALRNRSAARLDPAPLVEISPVPGRPKRTALWPPGVSSPGPSCGSSPASCRWSTRTVRTYAVPSPALRELSRWSG